MIDIKAIFIASTTSTHIKFILDGVKNKKIIFCEKPLDLSIKKIESCKKKIKRLNPKIQLGFNRRYDPTHNNLREQLLNGKRTFNFRSSEQHSMAEVQCWSNLEK